MSCGSIFVFVCVCACVVKSNKRERERERVHTYRPTPGNHPENTWRNIQMLQAHRYLNPCLVELDIEVQEVKYLSHQLLWMMHSNSPGHQTSSQMRVQKIHEEEHQIF